MKYYKGTRLVHSSQTKGVISDIDGDYSVVKWSKGRRDFYYNEEDLEKYMTIKESILPEDLFEV